MKPILISAKIILNGEWYIKQNPSQYGLTPNLTVRRLISEYYAIKNNLKDEIDNNTR